MSGGGSAGGGASGVELIFLTSTQYGGPFGGLTGADARCNTRAVAAGLSGTFRAWLADSGHTASSRFATGGPWYTVGASQTMVFLDASELASGARRTADVRDEWGAVISVAADDFWVGGAGASENCEDWSTGAGVKHGLTSSFASLPNTASSTCQLQRRLLCLQL